MSPPLFGGAGKAATREMRSYVESAPYDGLTDPQARKLFRDAFEATKRAVKSTNDFEKGQHTGEAEEAVLRTCSYYGFTECKEFTQGARDVTERLKGIMRAMDRLSTCGKNKFGK